MRYIHRSSLKSHGNLKSSSCLVDSRWTVKVSSFGLQSLNRNKTADKGEDESKYAELIWTAPELLALGERASQEGTEKGDVYSFGIMLQEILYRNSFFFDSDVSAEGRPTYRQSWFFFLLFRLLPSVGATAYCPLFVPAFFIILHHYSHCHVLSRRIQTPHFTHSRYLFPCRSMLAILLSIYPSSFLRTSPNHLSCVRIITLDYAYGNR